MLVSLSFNIKLYLFVPLYESPVFTSVLSVLIQTPETYMTLHSSALKIQFLKKTCLMYDHSSLSSILEFVIIVKGI